MTKEEYDAKIEELKNDEQKFNDEMEIVAAVYKQFSEMHTEYAERVKAMHHTWELETRMLDITNISIVGSTDVGTQEFSIDAVAVSGSGPNIVSALAQSLDQIGDDDTERNMIKLHLFLEISRNRSFRQFLISHMGEIMSKLKE